MTTRTSPRGETKGAAVSVIFAIGILVLIPSSALATITIGSYVPIVAAMGVLGIGLFQARRRLSKPVGIVPLSIGFAIVTFATIAYGSPNPFSLLLIAVFFPMYWLVFSATARERTIIIRAVVFLALFETALAFGEVLLGTGPLLGTAAFMVPDNPFLPGMPRAQGTLGHPLVLCFLQVAGLGLVCAMRAPLRVRVLLGGLLVAGSVTTGSVSGLLAGGIIAVIWVFNRRSLVSLTFAIIGSVIGAVAILSSGMTAGVIESELDERNAGHRWNSIAAMPNLVFQRDVIPSLFGSGYSGTADLYRSGIIKDDGFFTIDNQYVSFLAQSGVIGFALMLGALVIITTKITRDYLPGWLGLLAMGFSFDFMAWYVTGSLALVYAAVAMNDSARMRASPKTGKPPSRRNGRGTLVTPRRSGSAYSQ